MTVENKTNTKSYNVMKILAYINTKQVITHSQTHSIATRSLCYLHLRNTIYT